MAMTPMDKRSGSRRTPLLVHTSNHIYAIRFADIFEAEACQDRANGARLIHPVLGSISPSLVRLRKSGRSLSSMPFPAPPPTVPATSIADVDTAIERLHAKKDAWLAVPIA